MTEFFLASENDIQNIDVVKERLYARFKNFISTSKYTDNETLSRYFLEHAFWIAILFNQSDDKDLVGYLTEIIQFWRPGEGNKFAADEYERQHIALALLNLSKLYMSKTIEYFYIPIYREFIQTELTAEKSMEGAKVQLA